MVSSIMEYFSFFFYRIEAELACFLFITQEVVELRIAEFATKLIHMFPESQINLGRSYKL